MTGRAEENTSIDTLWFPFIIYQQLNYQNLSKATEMFNVYLHGQIFNIHSPLPFYKGITIVFKYLQIFLDANLLCPDF